MKLKRMNFSSLQPGGSSHWSLVNGDTDKMPPGHNAPGQNSPGHNAPGEDKMPRRIKTKVELKSYYLVQDFLIFVIYSGS